MKYSLDKQEKYTVINVHEEKLDAVVAPDLKSEFVNLNADGVNNIIVHLEKVKYVDSSGLSALLIANRLCKDSGGIFILSSVGEHVMKLIYISQLDKVMNITKTLEEGIDLALMDAVEKDLLNGETE